MKYAYLADEDKKQLWLAREQALLNDLLSLERQHYEAEIDRRLATRVVPPDTGGQAEAEAKQADLDEQHDALSKELAAFPQRRGT